MGFIMKILVIGHKQHGKGTFCDIATKNFSIRSMGTSRFKAERIFELMKDEYGYSSVEECYADRINHREFWFNNINDFCKDNYALVIEEILMKHDICEGVRNRVEFECAKTKRRFDLVIWIDASNRLPLESSSSMELTEDDADLIIKNNGTQEEFHKRCVNTLKLINKAI